MTLRRALRRLRLKAGDILLLHRDIPIDSILNCGAEYPIRILYFDNKNDILRLPFEELEKIYLEAKKQHGEHRSSDSKNINS